MNRQSKTTDLPQGYKRTLLEHKSREMRPRNKTFGQSHTTETKAHVKFIVNNLENQELK